MLAPDELDCDPRRLIDLDKGRNEGMVTYPRLPMVKLKVMPFTVIQYEGRYQERRCVHILDSEESGGK